MERTLSLAVYVVFTLLGAALILYIVIQSRPDVDASSINCDVDPVCGEKEYGYTTCTPGGKVTCVLTQQGCVVASLEDCVCTGPENEAVCETI